MSSKYINELQVDDTITDDDLMLIGSLTTGISRRTTLGAIKANILNGITTDVELAVVQNAVRVHPAYVAPVSVISSTQSPSGLEIGQTVSIPLTVAFTQNDAGAASGTVIKKDGSTVSTITTFTDSGVVMSATPKVYQGVVSYAQGPVKTNNLQEQDTVGQIAAGSANSNSLSYRGYYKYFFGPVSSQPANSAAVRALSSQLETNGTVTLNTGSTLINFAFWIPGTHTLQSVVDLDALNVDITASYILISGAFNVNDAAGVAVSGKLYMLTQAVPYTISHRHQITIS